MADCWDWCRKKNLPNYSEFYEMRHFEPANGELDYIRTEPKIKVFWAILSMHLYFDAFSIHSTIQDFLQLDEKTEQKVFF